MHLGLFTAASPDATLEEVADFASANGFKALELAAWGTDGTTLPWLTPPPAAALATARALLHDLGAIDTGGTITPHGRAMVRPVDVPVEGYGLTEELLEDGRPLVRDVQRLHAELLLDLQSLQLRAFLGEI